MPILFNNNNNSNIKNNGSSRLRQRTQISPANSFDMMNCSNGQQQNLHHRSLREYHNQGPILRDSSSSSQQCDNNNNNNNTEQRQNDIFRRKRRNNLSCWNRVMIFMQSKKDRKVVLLQFLIIGIIITLCIPMILFSITTSKTTNSSLSFPQRILNSLLRRRGSSASFFHNTVSIPYPVNTDDHKIIFTKSRRINKNDFNKILLPGPIIRSQHHHHHDDNDGYDYDGPDYGGLVIRFFDQNVGNMFKQARVIYYDPIMDTPYERMVPSDDDQAETDDVDTYYAYDDDVKRNPYNMWDDDNIQNTKHCRRTNWHRDLPINCNMLHEFDIQYRFRSGDTKFVASGAYREVYLSKLPSATVAFKALWWGNDFTPSDQEEMRKDALVAERLTAHNNIVDIYGYCGTSSINEAMMNGSIDKVVTPLGRHYTYIIPPAEHGQIIVKNGLTGTQKLEYALEMAESILALHSYPGGVIVHDDVKLNQFLFANDGHLKLNDFNRAEVMLYNEKDHEYCGYRNGRGNGDWRSPEEYLDRPINEKIDIYSLGNNIYALLTGLKPHFQLDDENHFKQLIINGDTAPIDPRFHQRSYGESKLVEILPRCWEYYPNDRIDIFDLVDFLRKAVQENRRRNNKQNVRTN